MRNVHCACWPFMFYVYMYRHPYKEKDPRCKGVLQGDRFEITLSCVWGTMQSHPSRVVEYCSMQGSLKWINSRPTVHAHLSPTVPAVVEVAFLHMHLSTLWSSLWDIFRSHSVVCCMCEYNMHDSIICSYVPAQCHVIRHVCKCLFAISAHRCIYIYCPWCGLQQMRLTSRPPVCTLSLSFYITTTLCPSLPHSVSAHVIFFLLCVCLCVWVCCVSVSVPWVHESFHHWYV